MRRIMTLFAALHEDAQNGWVWLKNSSFPLRSVVIIKNPKGKSVYCEVLQIDNNFLKKYNNSPRTFISEQKQENALVINGWYRAKLGNLQTKSDIQLDINPCNCSWGRFRACTHHPQIIVRVAAWLGLISVVLGIVGVVLGALPYLVKMAP